MQNINLIELFWYLRATIKEDGLIVLGAVWSQDKKESLPKPPVGQTSLCVFFHAFFNAWEENPLNIPKVYLILSFEEPWNEDK